jgi:hypothetical protein
MFQHFPFQGGLAADLEGFKEGFKFSVDSSIALDQVVHTCERVGRGYRGARVRAWLFAAPARLRGAWLGSGTWATHYDVGKLEALDVLKGPH